MNLEVCSNCGYMHVTKECVSGTRAYTTPRNGDLPDHFFGIASKALELHTKWEFNELIKRCHDAIDKGKFNTSRTMRTDLAEGVVSAFRTLNFDVTVSPPYGEDFVLVTVSWRKRAAK